MEENSNLPTMHLIQDYIRNSYNSKAKENNLIYKWKTCPKRQLLKEDIQTGL
jgi:hypothetical protein